MKKNKNSLIQSGFSPLLIILIIALVAVVGYFAYKNYSAKLQTQTQMSENLTSQTPDSLAAVSEPYKSLFSNTSKIFVENLDPKVQISYLSDGKLYWPVSNGALATVFLSPEIQIQSSCNGSSDESDSTFNAKMDSTLTKLDSYFLANGFKKISISGSSGTSFSQSNLGSVIGYQNNSQGLMCDLIFSKACGSDDPNTGINGPFFKSGYLSCNTGANFTLATTSELDYLLALGTPGNALDVIDTYGDYYNFNVNGLIGPGAGIIAEKTTHWINIYSGDDIMSCDTANKYKVPHQLKGADKCYDSTSQKTVVNTN
jgi:hypothetical protein